ncbi:MAG: sigma-70 family RNA polymerase sigma factor [Deltaproteobacteria bacterium]|nr:MAG: sigma-70 family RNA polymerase sigma factor [Deltaproteobacteria bacterium]
MPADETDEELLAAYRAGRTAAGEALFARHFRSVYRFFANKAGDDAEDLVQQTFERCLVASAGFEGRSSFRTFLFGVARNVLREHVRRKARHRARWDDREPPSVYDVGLSPARFVVEKREQRVLLEALRRLPLEHQIVLELYFWEHLSGRELAEVLGEPEGTVRGRLRRARARLERELAEVARSEGLLASTRTDLDAWAASLRERVGLANGAGDPDT